MVKTSLAGSTKQNFKFFCDPCLTKMEVAMVQSETQKINGLETKVDGIEKKLDEITKLLSRKETPQVRDAAPNIWSDKER